MGGWSQLETGDSSLRYSIRSMEQRLVSVFIGVAWHRKGWGPRSIHQSLCHDLQFAKAAAVLYCSRYRLFMWMAAAAGTSAGNGHLQMALDSNQLAWSLLAFMIFSFVMLLVGTF